MMYIADRVTIGQHWRRRRDGFEVLIRQVHRSDFQVEAEPITLRIEDVLGNARVIRLGFHELRDHYALMGS